MIDNSKPVTSLQSINISSTRSRGISISISLWVMKGTAEPCDVSAITASVTKNGSVVGGLPQWNVVISNACENCSQSNVVMLCPGYVDTVVGLDPNIVRLDGPYCNVYSPVVYDDPVKFTVGTKDKYPPNEPTPVSSVIRCIP
ncbi:hypothetical protein Vadar_026163 [Vaccinium darrowii]|uniref:Uncharacterized protein n=1 Tax=Vaccinium darrowii TaxID=229202 RepID=A0ACB7ZMG1_9ERIC|nr:hypothetical protein Vadar_026163 [Vaccinium darrowii]